MSTAALVAWFLLFFCLLCTHHHSLASTAVDTNLTTPSVQLADPQFHDLNGALATGEVIKSVSKSARRGKGGASDLAHSSPPGSHKSSSVSLLPPALTLALSLVSVIRYI